MFETLTQAPGGLGEGRHRLAGYLRQVQAQPHAHAGLRGEFLRRVLRQLTP